MRSPHRPADPENAPDADTPSEPDPVGIEHYVEDRLHRLPLEDLDEIARRITGLVHDLGGSVPL